MSEDLKQAHSVLAAPVLHTLFNWYKVMWELKFERRKLECLDYNENSRYDFSAGLSLKIVFWRFKVYTVLYIFNTQKQTWKTVHVSLYGHLHSELPWILKISVKMPKLHLKLSWRILNFNTYSTLVIENGIW